MFATAMQNCIRIYGLKTGVPLGFAGASGASYYSVVDGDHDGLYPQTLAREGYLMLLSLGEMVRGVCLGKMCVRLGKRSDYLFRF